MSLLSPDDIKAVECAFCYRTDRPQLRRQVSLHGSLPEQWGWSLEVISLYELNAVSAFIKRRVTVEGHHECIITLDRAFYWLGEYPMLAIDPASGLIDHLSLAVGTMLRQHEQLVSYGFYTLDGALYLKGGSDEPQLMLTRDSTVSSYMPGDTPPPQQNTIQLHLRSENPYADVCITSPAGEDVCRVLTTLMTQVREESPQVVAAVSPLLPREVLDRLIRSEASSC